MSAVLSATSVGWKLREVMARRKITNKALADELGIHQTTVSRLKTQDVLPEIGGSMLGQIIDAINNLSKDSYGACDLSDLIELTRKS